MIDKNTPRLSDVPIGVLIFIGLAFGTVATSDVFTAEVRVVCAAISAGCMGVIVRLFPTYGGKG